MNAQSKRFQITWPTRKGGRVPREYNLRLRPTLNVYLSWTLAGCLRPPEISIQFHMVSYCSAIKVCAYVKCLANTKMKKIRHHIIHYLFMKNSIKNSCYFYILLKYIEPAKSYVITELNLLQASWQNVP